MLRSILCLTLLSLLAVSCEKEEVKPEPIPTPQRPMLFNYRLTGFERIDTSQILLNGTPLASTSGYHRELKPGDKLFVYISGKIKTGVSCDFAIWQDKNELPNITYFRALERKWIHHIAYIDVQTPIDSIDHNHTGRPHRDSTIIYNYAHFIRGEFHVQ